MPGWRDEEAADPDYRHRFPAKLQPLPARFAGEGGVRARSIISGALRTDTGAVAALAA